MRRNSDFARRVGFILSAKPSFACTMNLPRLHFIRDSKWLNNTLTVIHEMQSFSKGPFTLTAMSCWHVLAWAQSSKGWCAFTCAEKQSKSLRHSAIYIWAETGECGRVPWRWKVLEGIWNQKVGHARLLMQDECRSYFIMWWKTVHWKSSPWCGFGYVHVVAKKFLKKLERYKQN